jgi:hypothetical protein
MTKVIYALLGAFLLACFATSISQANARDSFCVGLCIDNQRVPMHNGHYLVQQHHHGRHATWNGQPLVLRPMYYREGQHWHQVYWYPTAPKYYVQQPPKGYVLAQPPVYQPAPQPVYQTAPAYASAPVPQMPAYRPAPQQTLSAAELQQLNALRLKRAAAILPPPDGGQVGSMQETRKVGTPPSASCHQLVGTQHDATLGGTVQIWKRVC